MIDAGETDSDARLRRILAFTDATLSRLGVDELLDELLDRVTALLNVDTAVILLMDAHAKQLVTTAAKGLEDEVRRGFRLSIGRGFAGQVASTQQPIMVDNVTSAAVVSPVLLEKGVRSLLGVPMLAGGEVVGVMHVGSLSPRRFTAEEVQLLQLVADRASLASQARSRSIDRTATLALQRSLLPTRLPDVPGMDLAARYIPGHEAGLGGDWYDVFMLPTGWLGLVIGDVSGHGLRSAVVMGRLRSALRSYALISDDPAAALTLLDRKIQHFEAGNLTTAVYAMISPDRTTIRMSIAGHLRPIIAVPGGPASMPQAPVDPPLGMGRLLHTRRTISIPLPQAAVAVYYTDGLVERRGEVIDEGIDRLMAAVEADPAESVCAKIMSTIAAEQPTDDIALLAVHRRPDGP